MTVIKTIKAKAKKSSSRGNLVRTANAVASDLLDTQSDRVLVVYEGEGATVYYEGEEPTSPAATPRTAS
jgi:hypothetical protein